jgi:hypothetical protein
VVGDALFFSDVFCIEPKKEEKKVVLVEFEGFCARNNLMGLTRMD